MYEIITRPGVYAGAGTSRERKCSAMVLSFSGVLGTFLEGPSYPPEEKRQKDIHRCLGVWSWSTVWQKKSCRDRVQKDGRVNGGEKHE